MREYSWLPRSCRFWTRRLCRIPPQNWLGNASDPGQDGFARAGAVEDLDVLITDQKADQEVMDRIQELGVKVIVAKTEEAQT